MHDALQTATTSTRPRLPVGVRAISVGLAVLDVAWGVSAAVGLLLGISLMYMDSQSGPPQAALFALMGIVLVPVVGLLWVARRVWTGSGWARLTSQLICAYAFESVSVVTLASLGRSSLIFLPLGVAIAATFGAAAAYLETPHVRDAFGLEPLGVMGRHPTATLSVIGAFQVGWTLLLVLVNR